MNKQKTIEYRFCDVKSTKQEEMKQCYACVHFDYATRLVSKEKHLRVVFMQRSHPSKKKRSDAVLRVRFDYAT